MLNGYSEGANIIFSSIQSLIIFYMQAILHFNILKNNKKKKEYLVPANKFEKKGEMLFDKKEKESKV